jgi:large subunit ribosomal protein L40e
VYQSIFKEDCPFFYRDNLSGNKRGIDDITPEPILKVVFVRDPFKVQVKLLTGKNLSIDIGAENTVDDLKLIIKSVEGIPVDQQRLIFAGKQLENDRSMSDYNISKDTSIYLVLRLRGC